MLTERAVSRNEAAVRRLRAACLVHLLARIAEPLEPPRDWTRANTLPCRCRHCSELSQFLADPNRKVWTLKAAAPDREHVEDSIRCAGSDLDRATDQRGRPYTLISPRTRPVTNGGHNSARRILKRRHGWR